VRLRRADGRPLRIGHRGAAALAPANTLASIEAAIAAGVDGIEFDVVGIDGRVVLAHSRREWTEAAPTLAETLSFLRDRAPDDLLLMVDVKRPGFEHGVVGALVEADVLERTLVASYFGRALRTIRRLEPRLTTGVGYPTDRTGLAERYVPEPAVVAGLTAMRHVLPFRIARMVRGAEADVALIHHLAISPALVTRCRALGVDLLAWTVNDRRSLARVEALGVDAVVSDDPTIFGDSGRGNKNAASDVYDSS
jgi:glycerophosphoryl diester phosphodiesterase